MDERIIVHEARVALQTAIQASSDQLWEPIPPPAWCRDSDPFFANVRTKRLEILPDEEDDKCIFHASQVCMMVTQFTMTPYTHCGVVDIITFLQRGPEGRTAYTMADRVVEGVGHWSLEWPKWSFVFQTVLGKEVCSRLHDLGFTAVLSWWSPAPHNTTGNAPATMKASVDVAEAEGLMETKVEANADNTTSSSKVVCIERKRKRRRKRYNNMPEAVELVTNALGSSWVRINPAVAKRLGAVYYTTGLRKY